MPKNATCDDASRVHKIASILIASMVHLLFVDIETLAIVMKDQRSNCKRLRYDERCCITIERTGDGVWMDGRRD